MFFDVCTHSSLSLQPQQPELFLLFCCTAIGEHKFRIFIHFCHIVFLCTLIYDIWIVKNSRNRNKISSLPHLSTSFLIHFQLTFFARVEAGGVKGKNELFIAPFELSSPSLGRRNSCAAWGAYGCVVKFIEERRRCHLAKCKTLIHARLRDVWLKALCSMNHLWIPFHDTSKEWGEINAKRMKTKTTSGEVCERCRKSFSFTGDISSVPCGEVRGNFIWVAINFWNLLILKQFLRIWQGARGKFRDLFFYL